MMAESQQGGLGWWHAAAFWTKAWLATSAAMVLAAIVAALIDVWLAPAPNEPNASPIVGSLGAFQAILSVIVFGVTAAKVALALLAALPLQATALHLRTRAAGPPIFAAVAALTGGAAVLSFLALYVLARPLVLLVPSPEILTVALIGCYVLHVIIFVGARRLVGHARRGAAAAF